MTPDGYVIFTMRPQLLQRIRAYRLQQPIAWRRFGCLLLSQQVLVDKRQQLA
jgi:hypothetical protein